MHVHVLHNIPIYTPFVRLIISRDGWMMEMTGLNTLFSSPKQKRSGSSPMELLT